MSNLKKHLTLGVKRIIAPNLLAIRPRHFVHQNVPYFSQWESRALCRDILAKNIKAEDDPKWRESGAKTKQEYAAWSWSGCGMACLKMALAHRTGQVVPLVELGKKCAAYGGYTFPLETGIGLLYVPFVRFAYAEFDLKAQAVGVMTWQEIVRALSQKGYVLASVSSEIRRPKSSPKPKGGHLILMVGYDLDKKQFLFHNPSGDSKATQEYAVVSFADFKKFFNNRGIIIQAG